MASKKNNPAGFTLVEALLVIVLISVLAAIIVPNLNYKYVLRYKVYAVAHEIASDLRLARRMSTGGDTKGWPYSSGGTANNYWFKLYSQGNSTDTFQVFRINDESSPMRTTTTYGGDIVISGSSTDSYYFNIRGEPSPADNSYITVRDAGSNYQWNVSIIRTTGRISMRKVK